MRPRDMKKVQEWAREMGGDKFADLVPALSAGDIAKAAQELDDRRRILARTSAFLQRSRDTLDYALEMHESMLKEPTPTLDLCRERLTRAAAAISDTHATEVAP